MASIHGQVSNKMVVNRIFGEQMRLSHGKQRRWKSHSHLPPPLARAMHCFVCQTETQRLRLANLFHFCLIPITNPANTLFAVYTGYWWCCRRRRCSCGLMNSRIHSESLWGYKRRHQRSSSQQSPYRLYCVNNEKKGFLSTSSRNIFRFSKKTNWIA